MRRLALAVALLVATTAHAQDTGRTSEPTGPRRDTGRTEEPSRPLESTGRTEEPSVETPTGRTEGPATREAPEERKERPLAQWGRGPFEVQDPFILAELRASPMARSPGIPRSGAVEVGLRGIWENSYGFGRDEAVFNGATMPPVRFALDAETRGLDLVARAGILGRLELGAELRALHWRGGGHLDSLVEQFHRSFGIGDLNRDERPEDGYRVAGVASPSRGPFNLRGRKTRLGDLTLSARALLLEGGDYHPAVTVGMRLWVATASRGFDHATGLAETFTLDLSKRIGDLPLVLYAGAAYTYYDETRIQTLRFHRHRGMYYAGFEVEVHPRVSLVAHYWQETPREKGLFRRTSVPYGNFVSYVAGGVKFEPIDGLTIEVGLIENVIDPSTTGDIGFLLNVFWRFEPFE